MLHTSSEYQLFADGVTAIFIAYYYVLKKMVPPFFYLHLILGHKRERMIIVSALRAKRERVSERLWCARPIERWSARTTPLHSCSTAETEWYSSFFVFYYYYHIYTVYTTYFFFFFHGESLSLFFAFFFLLKTSCSFSLFSLFFVVLYFLAGLLLCYLFLQLTI